MYKGGPDVIYTVRDKIEPRVACRGQLDLTERAWVLELCSLRFKFQGVNLTV